MPMMSGGRLVAGGSRRRRDYRRDMIGELMETSRGWALQAPAECINGHPPRAGGRSCR